MTEAPGIYLPDPLVQDDWLNQVMNDTPLDEIPSYFTARDLRCLILDLQRARHVALSTISVGERDAVLEEALIKCRDRFREYAELHRAKIGSVPPYDVNAVKDKVTRNQEMADMCDAALRSSPAALDKGAEVRLAECEETLIAKIEKLLMADPNVGGCSYETMSAIAALDKGAAFVGRVEALRELVEKVDNCPPHWEASLAGHEARLASAAVNLVREALATPDLAAEGEG